MIETAQAGSLSDLLAAREDPMAACSLKWLKHFKKVPDDAGMPLAMSDAHPRAVGSYGAECVEWARVELGVTLRWWQALAVTRQLEHDADGVLVWREIVESGPRRIGKSTRLRVVALWRLANAERFKETQLAMLVSKDLAVGKEIHRGSWRWAGTKGWGVLRLGGAQEVETPTGDRWLLRAPNAVYGYDVGYGQVDEAWDVDPAAITDGLEPALLERESPQLHLTSTAHVRASSLMRRRLTAALRSADPDVLLLFWGAHPDADIADEAAWRAASPHWSKARRDLLARKYAAALAGQDEPEFDDPDPVRGWAAQYLNVWPLLLGGDRTERIFPDWEDRAAPNVKPSPSLTFGIAAPVGMSCFYLGAFGEGHAAIITPRELGVARVPGRQQQTFVAAVARITDGAPVALQVKGPAWSLKPELEDAGVRVVDATFDDFVQAGSGWATAMSAAELTHSDDPDLNAAAAAARWKTVNDRQVLSRKFGDIAALEATILARWVASQSTEVWEVWT
ncbi:MAG: hypothetical protein AB7G17_14400 [Phycisphaerales bacterium]